MKWSKTLKRNSPYAFAAIIIKSPLISTATPKFAFAPQGERIKLWKNHSVGASTVKTCTTPVNRLQPLDPITIIPLSLATAVANKAVSSRPAYRTYFGYAYG